MILPIVLFILIAIITWRIIQTTFNPLAHWLNTGADNEATMHESELTKLLDTADRYYQEHSWLSAEKAYLKILKLDHANLFAFRRLGLIYSYIHNYIDAAECLEIVLKSDPTAADLQNYATICHHLGHLAKATKAMEQALELDPTVARAISLSKLYAEAKDISKQYEALKIAVEIEPHNQVVKDLLGQLQRLETTRPN